MATQLLMPKATAVWLVDNTALTFDQIAEFCTLHPLEVAAIADGESAQGIKGLDPINTGQLSRDEIAKAEGDPNHKLKMLEPKVRVPPIKKKGPRYTPLSKRQDRPNAILWLIRNHPELKVAQISRLVGTTKNTIDQIRERTHWNSPNLQPVDPVALGLCTQIELDFEVARAAKNKPAEPEVEATEEAPITAVDPALMPATQTENLTAEDVFSTPVDAPAAEPNSNEEDEIDPDSVFAKLKSLKTDEKAD
ncbi:MAG: cell cycle transcriptional regulator TrcR [Pseudomonadota bacterium]